MKKGSPTKNHRQFVKQAKTVIGETVLSYGFKLHREEYEKWFSTIIYRREEHYIKIAVNTHFRNQPSVYNIVLGEGDSENFMEWDWNSIALWRLKKR